jgi:hypothetical protein
MSGGSHCKPNAAEIGIARFSGLDLLANGPTEPGEERKSSAPLD